MNREYLKPCPFCTGEASVGIASNSHFVNCVDCGASIGVLVPHSLTRTEAISLWNERPNPVREQFESECG